MNCINLSRLIAYRSDDLGASEQEGIQRHLDSCQKCKDQLLDYDQFSQFLKLNFPVQEKTAPARCFDESELASFLAGGFKRSARKELYVHLKGCESCMDSLLGVESLLTELKHENLVPVQRGLAIKTRESFAHLTSTALGKIQSVQDALIFPKPAYHWVSVALVIIVAGLIFKPSDDSVNIPLINRETSVEESQMRVQLLAPDNRSSVPERYPEFRWAGPSQVKTYTFLLLDGNGEIIWEQKTGENRVTLPRDIQLQPATVYFWQVEGLWPDEGSTVSEMMSFTHNPK